MADGVMSEERAARVGRRITLPTRMSLWGGSGLLLSWQCFCEKYQGVHKTDLHLFQKHTPEATSHQPSTCRLIKIHTVSRYRCPEDHAYKSLVPWEDQQALTQLQQGKMGFHLRESDARISTNSCGGKERHFIIYHAIYTNMQLTAIAVYVEDIIMLSSLCS